MGCGKSTIGVELSKRLDFDLIDIDSVITAKHGDITAIFDSSGEAGFRKIESLEIENASKNIKKVISLGGGACQNSNNMLYLIGGSVIVFLNASSSALLDRLSSSHTRPLLKDLTIDKIDDILKNRLDNYKKFANIIIDTDNKNVNEICDEIISKINNIEGK